METMDEAWLDRWLAVLEVHYGKKQSSQFVLFEPAAHFYGQLETGDESDVQAAAAAIGAHIRLRTTPAVGYEWGLRMNPERAGQIALQAGSAGHVQIPFFYVGKPLALGAILAHELTHQYMTDMELSSADPEENEALTDLASIRLGLGKLVLNGMFVEWAPSIGQFHGLGYLGPEMKVRAYRKVNSSHGIRPAAARSNLTPVAIRFLDAQR